MTEQTATTSEVSRSVAEAATGSTEVATDISGVVAAAESTAAGVTDSRQAIDELARTSGQLHALVQRFTVG